MVKAIEMKIVAFVAATLLGVGGTSLGYPGSAAEAAQSAANQLARTHNVEMIAAASTILSTAHYQASIDLVCAGGSCNGDFPKPGLNHQLNVTRVSCILTGTAGSIYDLGVANFINSAGVFVFHESLPEDYSDGLAHSVNSAIDMQLVGGQHLQISLAILAGTGTAKFVFCTATGTLSTLG